MVDWFGDGVEVLGFEVERKRERGRERARESKREGAGGREN